MNVLDTLIRILSLMMITMVKPCTSVGAYMEMIINNGIAPQPSASCSAAENKRIDDCFLRAGIRNLLRGTTNTTLQGHNQQDQRQLYPLSCKDLCAGYVAGMCRAKKCNGYRRELDNNELVEHHDEHHSRKLNLDMVSCNRTIQLTNNCLDKNVLLSVSSSCKNLFHPSKRTASCRLFDEC